jgi:hypothetical protein
VVLQKKIVNEKCKVEKCKVEKCKVSKREVKRQKDIETYRKLYELYKVEGFEALKNKMDYKFSQENFVQRCKRLLPEFVPQNGKRRSR